jgi:hypothetical protein
LSHCHHATFKQEASSACGTRPWFIENGWKM